MLRKCSALTARPTLALLLLLLLRASALLVHTYVRYWYGRTSAGGKLTLVRLLAASGSTNTSAFC